MHRGNHGILSLVHRNLWRCRFARFREFHAGSMRTLFYCLKCFRPVAQTLYPHNSLRSLSLHFYVASCSKRTGRHLCSACADQENENLISNPHANSGPWCRLDPSRFRRLYGFFQPGRNSRKVTTVTLHKLPVESTRLAAKANLIIIPSARIEYELAIMVSYNRSTLY